MWQDAVVTLIALGALAMLGRRVLRARRRPTPSCASCAVNKGPKREAQAPEAKPITFYR